MEKLERRRVTEQMGGVRFQRCWRSRSGWSAQRGSEKIKKLRGKVITRGERKRLEMLMRKVESGAGGGRQRKVKGEAFT